MKLNPGVVFLADSLELHRMRHSRRTRLLHNPFSLSLFTVIINLQLHKGGLFLHKAIVLSMELERKDTIYFCFRRWVNHGIARVEFLKFWGGEHGMCCVALRPGRSGG